MPMTVDPLHIIHCNDEHVSGTQQDRVNLPRVSVGAAPKQPCGTSRDASMNSLGDDLLLEIFREVPWCERARLASVCRRWHTVTSTHAADVWHTLHIDEPTDGLTACNLSLVRWCQLHSRHVREMRVLVNNQSAALPGISSHSLTKLCAILFPNSSQLRRLSVAAHHDDCTHPLPRKFFADLSVASALEYLSLAVPGHHVLRSMADAISSLQKIKVAHLQYIGPIETVHKVALKCQGLVSALSGCPLREELKLSGFYLGTLSADLAAATRLTSLLLDNDVIYDIPAVAAALPCSLQRFRMTEEPFSCVTLPQLPKDFASLVCLQQLQLTIPDWGLQPLPSRLLSLRLAAPRDDACRSADLMSSISCLASLEQLHIRGFEALGWRPADVAAALRPLLRLRALGFDTCGFQQSPAKDILTRLSLLSLRDNRLTTLADALPADAVRSLQVLDVSGNFLGQRPNYWTAANVAAFSGDWASLRVVGMRPRALGNAQEPAEQKALKQVLALADAPGGMRATARALALLLRRQAAVAQPPRLPPVVVCSGLHEQLLCEADDLAVVA